MERGRGKHRRGGGGCRRRPAGDRSSGTDREVAHPDGGRGKRDGNEVADSRDEEKAPSGFSRRKILSNWDRYAEKEAALESGDLQRGADFRVLLSSAGDAFTQFRFADEREWDTDNLSNKQESALYLDSQALVRALQQLPLHLRLNVDAELVQDELPQELPQFKPKGNMNQPPTFINQTGIGASAGSTPGSLPLPELHTGDTRKPTETAQALDEELDFLLSLEASVREETGSNLNPGATGVSHEQDLQLTREAHDPSPVPEDLCSAAEGKHTPVAVTPEDLEDWLDSMIS